jgi:hypothetical protein
MYDTLTENVLGHIQDYKIEDNSLTIVGWCFHFSDGLLPIRLNYDNTAFEKPNGIFKIESRLDVCDVFKNTNIENCGWTIHIKQSEIIDTLKIEMKIDNEWKPVFDFRINPLHQRIAFL